VNANALASFIRTVFPAVVVRLRGEVINATGGAAAAVRRTRQRRPRGDDLYVSCNSQYHASVFVINTTKIAHLNSMAIFFYIEE